MKCIIRKATAEDIIPALELAEKGFYKFEAPLYSEKGISNFIDGCTRNDEYIENYTSGRHAMFIALLDSTIIGMICERGGGRISMLFVDETYHRKGIATRLMDKMIEYISGQGYFEAELGSSPYGVPFYLSYGFVTTDTEQNFDGMIFTPMKYVFID